MNRLSFVLASFLAACCGTAGAEIILQQGFEDFTVDASGHQGNPDEVGGRFGPLYPHAGSPPQSNRLANAADTAMHSGSNGLAVVCGDSDSQFGVRHHWRITRSVPLRGPDNAFELSFWLKREEGGAVVVNVVEDDSHGGSAFLVCADGRVGFCGADGDWDYTVVMPVGTWWQFRFFVDQAEKTYALSYRTKAAAEWVELCTAIAYAKELSFNGLDLYPHFGAATLPARVYVDDILTVSVPETDRVRERDRLQERRRRAAELRAKEAAEYWVPLRRAADGNRGENPLHTSMPPMPEEPVDYVNMWDPFVLRAPGTGAGLEITAQAADHDRVMSGFDVLPWNGRQIARDSSGNWLILLEQEAGKIFLAWGRGTSGNPYRPRGGDLTTVALLAAGDSALLPGQGKAQRASMALDGENRLHVVWHRSDGLWHAQADLGTSSLEALREKRAWSEPKQLAKGHCRAGDIMRDAAGAVMVSYARDDTVYCQSVTDAEAETVAERAAGMPEMPPRGGRLPMSERECQDAVMDVAPDGSVYLAFRRDFCIWVARRTPAGKWQPPERVAREYVFHPSIMIADGQPLVTFLHEGLRSIPLDTGDTLSQRAGGGPILGYARLGENGWRTGVIIAAEEIGVFRRGMWSKRYHGRIFPQIEQLGWPVVFRDPQGVVWALWQNTTRRWAYSARWMGEEFGQVQECRGPFNAPCLPVTAEKHAPAGAGDAGVMFFAAAAGGNSRAIFDRVRIPSLSTAEHREVLFLDSLEVAGTTGAEFVLNQMAKSSPYPSLSPRDTNCIVWGASVTRHGDTYVMKYSSPKGGDDGTPRHGLAVSRDGVHFEKVDTLPEDLPEAEATENRPLAYWNGTPENTAQKQYLNPDQSDPARRYIRLGYTREERGTYSMEYSPDGADWTDRTETTAVESMREGGRPSVFIPEDPERPIRIYSRVYTETGRSWGVIWSRDLLRWGGMEHLLDVDDPYGTKPAEDTIGVTGKRYAMRGQVYMDSVAGKGEDEIYASSVRVAEGLHFCFYWPGRQGRPLTDVGIAVSRDGFNFTRVKNGERTLPVGPPGAWDSGYIFQMSPMLEGETVRVYYRGTAARREGTDGYGHNLTEVGLATIRVNGWTYYTPRAGCNRATITTIPIQSPAGTNKRLAVNIEGLVGKPHAFAVEVLDAATGTALEGFGPDDCQMPTEDGLHVPVVWNGSATLPAGRDIRLRFHLGAPGVRLYSFGFRSSSAP